MKQFILIAFTLMLFGCEGKPRMVSKEEYTKEEFYKNFIGMQKLSGQGTPGIVKIQGGSVIEEYLNELILFILYMIVK
jgi:hypothetical protein